MCFCGGVSPLDAPVLGRVVPDDFIPYAEKTGFIIDIDMFVLETVCKYMRSWTES